MRRILTILSLIILTTNHFGYAIPKNHSKNKTLQIPILFNDLSKFKQVDYHNFTVTHWQGAGRPLDAVNSGYYLKTINSVQASCDLGSSDSPSHSGGCWIPSNRTSGSASLSNSLSSPTLVGLVSTNAGTLGTLKQVPVTPPGIIFKTLQVGEKVTFPKVPEKELAGEELKKQNSTLTCVVPDQNTFGCIFSTKHGFYINNEKVQTF